MFTKLAPIVGNILISHNLTTLGNTVKSINEIGLKKIHDLIKAQTDLDLFTDSIIEQGLSSEDVSLLQQLEKDNLLELKKYKIEYSKNTVNDTNDYSDIHEKITITNHGGWFANNFIYIFAFFWSIFATTYIGSITFMDIPPENQRFADTILGFVLGTAIPCVIQFFFGSSFKGIPYTTNTKISNK